MSKESFSKFEKGPKRDVPEITDVNETLRELAGVGYTSFSYAKGPWVLRGESEGRIVREWAVKHSEGRVVAISVFKTFTESGHTVRSNPQRSDYETPDGYQAHVDDWQLDIDPEQPLVDLIQPAE